MSFTLIESLGDDTVIIDGRTFPLPALVEDEDGIRLLLVRDDVVPVYAWTQAHASGAAALLCATSTEGSVTAEHPFNWHWMLAETFIEGRTEHHASASYVAPAAWGGPEGHPPSYRDIQQALGEEILTATGGFVHLHAHSECSPLDGMSTVKEMVAAAVADGQPALAVTDHGVCAAHPHLQIECDKAGIKPIFGIEANFVPDRFRRPKEWVDEEAKRKVTDAKEVASEYRHLILWAMDQQGLHNLWAASTEANREGFYGRPRMDWDTLVRHSEGVMASTACLRGPLADDLLAGNQDQARATLGRLMDVFPGRLYVELHTNQLDEQIRLNGMLVSLAQEYDLPLIAVVDSHYACVEDAEAHRVWIASQTNKDLTDDADLFAGQQDYHVMSEAEVRAALAYLGPQVVDEAVRNTLAVADRCSAKIEGKPSAPVYSKQGGAQRDVERMVDLCMAAWDTKCVGKAKPVEVYEERFEREARLIISKGFPGYFLMVADYCLAAKEGRVRKDGRPILVGPGRGSGGGSLIAYLMGITDLDPVDGDLLFERFLTEGRVALPDFDVDFPASARDDLTDYLKDKYGREHVLRVGTHIRLQNKGVVRDLARVLKTTMGDSLHYPDIDAVCKIIDAAEADKAGLGMSWDDLWDQHGEQLDPYRERYPTLFALADRMVGRLKSYGKHPAGVIISTDEPLTGRLPMRLAGEQLVAEFDMDALEALGYVKFDLLTLRTLDSIQEAVDLVYEQTGVQTDVYSWREEYADPQVWEEIADGHTMGIFQIETRAGTKLTKRFRPSSLHDLADVITLVRPGPDRSGLTETYLRRREGLEPVSYPDPRLESVLGKTYGCLLYQEDIMQTCMVLAGYDSNEADEVRKILGKKKIEKVAEAGRKFVTAAVANGMERSAAEALWDQMAEFAKYSFNRAHAYGYAVLGYWTAWLKFHWQAQFLAAVLSTVDKDRIPEFVNEARRMGYKVLPPDINLSGIGFSCHGTEVRYGLDGIKGIGDKAVQAVVKGQPYTSFQDFLDRKGDAANAGVVKILASVGAFDSLEPNRKALEQRLAWEASGDSVRCVFKDDKALGPGGLPCAFSWAQEKDPPLVKVKGQFVPKPPPKRCTKACRNYTAPTLTNVVVPYTEGEIRDRELELLGIHLSSTPFDIIPTDIMDTLHTAEDVESGPPGEYDIPGIIRRVKPITTKHGKQMAFLTIYAQTSELEVTVFSDEWERFQADLKKDRLCVVYGRKNDRGVNLVNLLPL